MLCLDRLSVLFEGYPGIVRFRVDVGRLGAAAQNLRFSFENQLTGAKVSPPPLRGSRRGLQELNINFPEQKAGGYVWYVTAEYESGGTVRAFTGEVPLVVERPQDARKVVDQLVLNISTTVHAGHASDVHLNQSAAEALEKIAQSPEDPVKALRRLVDGSARAWTGVTLFEIPKGPHRLTLTHGDEVWQLLSDETVTFGRSTQTTVPLRICGGDGRVDLDLNQRNQQAFLSSCQFTLERSGNQCVLRDGADGGKASNGVRVDGQEVPSHGTVNLPAGRVADMNVGFEGHGLGLRVRFHRDAQGDASGVVLDRLDGARQRVFVVWRELPIGGGESLTWDGERWYLSRNGSTAVIPLAVGSTVSIGGKAFAVQPFHKTHLY